VPIGGNEIGGFEILVTLLVARDLLCTKRRYSVNIKVVLFKKIPEILKIISCALLNRQDRQSVMALAM
jgi:hypothetical protein